MSKPARIAFRPFDGLLLLDKPAGISSNAALQRARRLLRAEKGGHTGALDPLATGMLPLCFGEATKIAGRLLDNDKAYLATIKLGQTTDTDDADGKVLRERGVPELTQDLLQSALQAFVGSIRQVPPIYSALKQGGEALYEKARRGEEIEIAARDVRVDCIELLAQRGNEIDIEVQCGSGTYIRSLARDLGEALGCGGHVAALRRLWVAPFRGHRMFSLEELEALAAEGEAALEAACLPLAAALADWPRLQLDASQAARLRQGQRLGGMPAVPAEYAGFDPDGLPIGLLQLGEDGVLRPLRLFNLTTGRH